MEQDEVHAVLDPLRTAGIPTWVAGGWGGRCPRRSADPRPPPRPRPSHRRGATRGLPGNPGRERLRRGDGLATRAAYVSLRYAPSPIETALVVVTVALLALAVIGFLGSRRGHSAIFVAVALILPYILAGAAFLAIAQRASSALNDAFSTSSDTGSDTSSRSAGPTSASPSESTDSQGQELGGPCVDVSQFRTITVGMTQTEVTRTFNLAGTAAGGGAGGFTQEYPDCAGSGSVFYVTFDNSQRPYRVVEKRHR